MVIETNKQKFEEKNPKWPNKKTEFFNPTDSQYFFAKISGIN